MTSCLIGARVAPKSYTPRDFARDKGAGKFPFDVDSAGYLQCSRDPLGLAAAR